MTTEIQSDRNEGTKGLGSLSDFPVILSSRGGESFTCLCPTSLCLIIHLCIDLQTVFQRVERMNGEQRCIHLLLYIYISWDWLQQFWDP